MGGSDKDWATVHSIFCIAYSPQGDRLASGSSDNTVRLWDAKKGNCLRLLKGHSNHVQGVAFSPNGGMVASASDDKTLRIWDVETGQQHRTLDAHTDRVLSVVYSPDGTQIASGSMDSTARIWDVKTGQCRQTLMGHTGWVRDVAFSPKGNQLASAGYDKTIRLWDVVAGECRPPLTGHNDKVSCVAYSSQSGLLASSSWDETVRLWDVASGCCQAKIQYLPGLMRGVAWSPLPEGNCFVTGSTDGSVLKWEVMMEGGLCRVRLLWSATNGTLIASGAFIQDARGLSQTNKQLLKQRGAIGETCTCYMWQAAGHRDSTLQTQRKTDHHGIGGILGFVSDERCIES
ncbi:hypothetical protein BGX34_002960 [Mortierella sp. NVP85]|nr:hypothetical protein BGX34_002960 [Mortierella sp. NVP85]